MSKTIYGVLHYAGQYDLPSKGVHSVLLGTARSPYSYALTCASTRARVKRSDQTFVFVTPKQAWHMEFPAPRSDFVGFDLLAHSEEM